MNNVMKLNNNGTVSDSFSKHFTKHAHVSLIIAKDIKPIFNTKVTKRLNPIAALNALYLINTNFV